MVVPSTLLACEDHAMLHKAASTSPDRVDLSCSEAPIIRGVVCSPFLDPHQQRYYAVVPALYRKSTKSAARNLLLPHILLSNTAFLSRPLASLIKVLE